MFLHCSEKPIVAQLGFRFWDPVKNAQVTNDLEVTASTVDGYRRTFKAFQTPSGIYAFQGLPGLHDVEYPVKDTSGKEIIETELVIEVTDNQHRYLPMAFLFKEKMPLAYTGIYRNTIFEELYPTSPPESGLPLIYLFSAPTRHAGPGLAAVRCQLTDYSTARPASHAVLEITVKGRKWFGMANDKGNAVVYFPFPSVDNYYFGASPPMSVSRSVSAQKWNLSIRVKYSPASLLKLPASGNKGNAPESTGRTVPDIRSILSQQHAHIWLHDLESPGGPTTDFELNEELTYGQEVVLRTGTMSELLLETVPTSP
jgi:hypothetical protein